MSPTHVTRRSTRRDALGDEAARAGEEACLVSVVAHYHEPVRPPGLLLCLDPDDSLEIGRGAVTAFSQKESGGWRLDLADEWASQLHASLRGPRLRDAGSRNGTRVNGLAVDAARLADGDLVEVGHTLLCCRRRPTTVAHEVCATAESLAGTGELTLSPTFLTEVERARRVAPSRLPVVVTGETGAGKEVLARAVHRWSERSGPFIAVNCAAIPTGLAESELFGHRRGAFSGAHEDRRGLTEAADRGTLLLDEVDVLPVEVQPKLLRFLQDGCVRRIGESEERTPDVRILAASNRDLDTAVASGTVRVDLFARLCGLVVHVPPLRERREDIGLLVARLVERHAGAGAAEIEIDAEAWRTLVRRRWTNNVRELERCIQAAILLAKDGRVVGPEHVRERVVGAEAPEKPAQRTRGRVRRDLAHVEEALRAALARHRGNLAAVARDLGVSRMQVYRWTQRFGISPDAFRVEED